MPSTDTPIPAQLTVVAWPDPVVDALGFLPHDPYSELLWTPTLGPSAVLAWRRMAGTLIHRPEGYTLDVSDFAQALGLGTGTAHHAPVCRTLRRLAVFRHGPLRRRRHLRRAPPHPAGVDVPAAPAQPRAPAAPPSPASPPRQRPPGPGVRAPTPGGLSAAPPAQPSILGRRLRSSGPSEASGPARLPARDPQRRVSRPPGVRLDLHPYVQTRGDGSSRSACSRP